MKRAVILGGGFAGLAATSYLRRHDGELETVLVDEHGINQFRPLLPDVVGRRLGLDRLSYPLRGARETADCLVLQQRVTGVDPAARVLRTAGEDIPFDYLILACGVDTEFHGVDSAAEHAFRFRDVWHGRRLREALARRPEEAVVVVGGGYTGIEAVTHIHRLDRAAGRRRRRVLVEITDSVCPGVPEAFRSYVHREVTGLGIEVRLETSVEEVTPSAARLSDGETIEPALTLWSAGVSTGAALAELTVEKRQQGRLAVDETLQIAEGCFAAGDCAAFLDAEGQPLRMGVQFSLSEGKHAAANLLRLHRGRPLQPFEPFDPGYLIPMGHNRACGLVLGRRVFGRKAMAFHYLMCLFRTHGLGRRAAVLRSLF